MSFFCDLTDLQSESDVEQKFFIRILTDQSLGLGFSTKEIMTKGRILAQQIDKGTHKKSYTPDYIIIISGLPVAVCEIKNVGQDLNNALHEARLYAGVINSHHPTGVNPCNQVIVSNGEQTIVAPWDSQSITCSVPFDEVNAASESYGTFREILNPSTLRNWAATIRTKTGLPKYFRPLDLFQGNDPLDDELTSNPLGTQVSQKFRHIFKPERPEDRSYIVRHAYVISQKRIAYVEQIKQAFDIPDAVNVRLDQTPMKSVNERQSKRNQNLTGKTMILVGPAGAGKSTFIDYLKASAIPQETIATTVWITIDQAIYGVPRNR